MKHAKGFSLLELLIVIAIVGILSAIGVGNLPRDRFAVQQAAQGLSRSVQLARFEAINRNTFVGVNVKEAAGGNRYVLFIDANRNAKYDTGETEIRNVQLGADETALVNVSSPSEMNLVFDPRGVTYFVGTPADSTVVLGSKTTSYSRSVLISAQGRARIQ